MIDYEAKSKFKPDPEPGSAAITLTRKNLVPTTPVSRDYVNAHRLRANDRFPYAEKSLSKGSPKRQTTSTSPNHSFQQKPIVIDDIGQT